MHAIAHSLPLHPSAFILTVMTSFMTEHFCHFSENEEERRENSPASSAAASTCGVYTRSVEELLEKPSTSLRFDASFLNFKTATNI